MNKIGLMADVPLAEHPEVSLLGVLTEVAALSPEMAEMEGV